MKGYQGEPSPDYRHRRVVDASKLELGDTWARIPYGTAIDIGGFGKGYLADQLGEYARTHGAKGYWIELSGDIATYGQRADGSAITIAVQSAAKNPTETHLVTCPRTPFGVATSGTLQRTTHKSTLQGHHIIDPRSGEPAETDIVLATVCADSALEADVLASSFVITNDDESQKDITSAMHGQSWLLQRLVEDKIAYSTVGSHIAYTKEPTHA